MDNQPTGVEVGDTLVETVIFGQKRNLIKLWHGMTAAPFMAIPCRATRVMVF